MDEIGALSFRATSKSNLKFEVKGATPRNSAISGRGFQLEKRVRAKSTLVLLKIGTQSKSRITERKEKTSH